MSVRKSKFKIINVLETTEKLVDSHSTLHSKINSKCNKYLIKEIKIMRIKMLFNYFKK